MNKLGKLGKILLLLVSFGSICLSVIEIISGQIGTISLFGFNLTEAQQKVTHYIASGGFATLGGVGIVINELLNKKTRDMKNVLEKALEVVVTIKDEYNDLKNEIAKLKKEQVETINVITEKMFQMEIKSDDINRLIRADLEAKLSNKLIDQTTKELINKALGYGKEQE